MPASCTLVRPSDVSSLNAAWKARRRSSLVFAGTCAETMSIAVSIRVPVALPLSSRMILPPTGSGVSSSMPASSSALLFAQPACPSIRPNHTGRSATTASMSAAEGNSLTGQSTWFQPRPLIQPEPGFALSYAAIIATVSSRLVTPVTFSSTFRKPWPETCPWESCSPGST